MAEFEKNNTRGIAVGGLTTGIIGTSLGALNALGGAGGLLGGLLGGGCGNGWNMAGCSDNVLINRYELGQSQEIESLKSQIALRDANTYRDGNTHRDSNTHRNRGDRLCRSLARPRHHL